MASPGRQPEGDEEPSKTSLRKTRKFNVKGLKPLSESSEEVVPLQPNPLPVKRVTQVFNMDDPQPGPSRGKPKKVRVSYVSDQSSRSSSGASQTNISPAKGTRKRPSVVLPELLPKEKDFFDLVKSGNVNAVKKFVMDNPGFNINCEDFQGTTALHIAVKDQNEAMVRYLLELPNIDVSDCALLAIQTKDSRILQLILDKLHEVSPGLEESGITKTSALMESETPLVLAAQEGDYEMIGLLLRRGHAIRYPHPLDCLCEECIAGIKEESLTRAYNRLAVYKAISNPAYIVQSSTDPLLTAFLLCRELNRCAQKEHEFRTEYEDLLYKLRQFSVELIACCKSSEEVECVLTRKEGCPTAGDFVFPRLLLAIDCFQKEFVAHHNIQLVLANAWSGDWYQWRQYSDLVKLLYIFPRLLYLPLTPILIVAPKTGTFRFWALPVNKMLFSIASYAIFLALVFVESNLDKSNQQRGPPDSGLEIPLMIFVASHIVNTFTLCMRHGPGRFFRFLWNWYDLLTQFFFVVTFVFWLVALLDVQKNDQRDLERKYWSSMDPTLVAEGFFALATILAFGRLMFLCQLNMFLGPLQVSLGKMTKDMFKFILIFSIILLAFGAGLCRMYQYYDGMVQQDTSNGVTKVQVSSFVSFVLTMKTLFWALFCMSPVESADVIVENLPGENDKEATVINQHAFTQTVGYIIYAAFEILSVIVVMNMLIGAMANSMAKVAENEDIEWKYGRTQVYINYMSQSKLPPPFNLLPTGSGFAYLFKWCNIYAKKPQGMTAKFSFARCCYVETEGIDENDKQFSRLMSDLTQRYFREKAQNGEGATDLEAIKRELSVLRSSLK